MPVGQNSTIEIDFAEMRRVKKQELLDRIKNRMPLPKLVSFQEELTAEAKKRGVGVGDLMKKVTDFLGIPQCPRCARWQILWNKIRVLPNQKINWKDVK